MTTAAPTPIPTRKAKNDPVETFLDIDSSCLFFDFGSYKTLSASPALMRNRSIAALAHKKLVSSTGS
jgi:hypothetical protein